MIRIILSSMGEADRKTLSILLIITFIFLLILGLLGMLIRFIMMRQGDAIETNVADVAKTHVVNSKKEFLVYGGKKNRRMFYKATLPAVLIAIIGLLIWVFGNIITRRWSANIFDDFSDLFFQFDWVGTPENPVFVKVFFLTLLSRWPDVTRTPTFVLEHLPSYLICLCLIASWVIYFFACQGYVCRFVKLRSLARSVYSKSLEGFNASEDENTNKVVPPGE